MNTQELSPICRQVRRDIITMTANAGSGHPGRFAVRGGADDQRLLQSHAR